MIQIDVLMDDHIFRKAQLYTVSSGSSVPVADLSLVCQPAACSNKGIGIVAGTKDSVYAIIYDLG